jgi:uncharacterized membrane protein (DUF106 family)
MKSSLKYSLLAAFLVITTKLIVFYTHSQFTNFGIFSGLTSLFLIIVPLFLAIKDKRDKDPGGFITLKEVMKTGLFVAVVAGLLNSVFIFFYYRFIDHETLSELIEQTQSVMHKAKTSQSEIDVTIINLQEFYSPFKQATGVLTGVLVAGIILSFVCSTFLVKNPPQDNNQI